MEPLITLMTDFGTRDGFPAQMKGVIHSLCPWATVVDITHDIQPYSIAEAAMVLLGYGRYFPLGTIHVAVVDPGVGGARRGIVLNSEGSYFVGPDNGVFSFIITAEAPWSIREITNPEFMLPDPHPTFHGRDVFAPVAAHLAAGTAFELVGPEIHDPALFSMPPVHRNPEGLVGEVIYVDRFGNLCSNLPADLLAGPVGSIEVGTLRVAGIHRCFSDVKPGTPLAMINSFGFLEIAINGGNAADSLGIDRGSKVRVVMRR
jgi:S-adenosyl-L-methionine hydrolase (adenosine-forming)